MADWTDQFRDDASTATIAKPLEPVSAPLTPAPPAPASGDWTQQFRSPPNPNLALKAGTDIAPDKAAQVLKLQDQTGLPTHVIGPNVEDVQAKQNQTALGPQFIADHPKTAELVGSDPHWAALLKDDIPGVAYMERQLDYLSNASMRSELELERTYHGIKGVAGLGGPDNSDRLAAIDKQLNDQFKPPAGAGPVAQVFGKASEAAVPYGVPLALATGGAAGAAAGAVAFGTMEMSNAYLDFKNKIDREGNQIPDDTARRWAIASGALTTGLGLATMGAGGEVANPTLKMLSRGGLGEMLENTGLRQAVTKLLESSIPASMLKTGTFFGGSQWGHIASEVMAGSKDMSPMAILRTIFSPENNKNVLESTAKGVATGGVIEAGMGAWKIWADYSKATDALNTQTAWSNVGNAMKDSKVMSVAPDQVPKIMDRLAGDGHVYVPLEKWQEWAETQKADPREAWRQATGSPDGYDEALKTGADLQMPSKVYASKIAPSDHNDFFSKVLRSNPDAMNAEEAEGFLGKQTPEEEAKRSAVYKIHEEVAPTAPPAPAAAPETTEIVPRGTSPSSPEQSLADQHLAAASQDLGHKPLDLEGLGMTPEQEGGIREAEARAVAAAQEKMVQTITDRQRRQATKEWNTERTGVESQVEQESWTHPEFVAQEVLSKPIETKARSEEIAKTDLTKYQADKERFDAWQEILRAGVKAPEGMGEEYKSLPARYRNGDRGIDEISQEAQEKGLIGPNDDIFKTIRELKRPAKPLSAEENVPQVLRELDPVKLKRSDIERDYPETNMDSFKGMMSDEVGVHPDVAAARLGFGSGDELLQKLSHLPKRNDWVQEQTNIRMQENHPEISADTNMPEAAIKAIHNNARGDLMRKELQHFYTKEFAAAKGLMSKLVGHLPSSAELKEDVDRDIGVQNYRQMDPRRYLAAIRSNNMLAEQASKAGEMQKMVDLKRAALRSFEMYRAAQDARDTIEKRVKKTDRYYKKSYQEMLGKAGGTYREDVNRLLNDPAFQDYKAIPFKDLLDHINEIDSKVYEAREQGKLYAMEKFTKLDDYRTGFIEQLAKDHNLTENEVGYPKPKISNETPFLPSAQAHLTRMEFYFDGLDKWKPNGLAKEGFSDPMAAARAHEGDLSQRQIDMLDKMVSEIPASERAFWYAKLHYIPEIDMSLLRENMIKVARYRQNDYSWKALLDGYGWSDAQGMAVISRLTEKELTLVDGMSKWFEAMRDEAFAKYKQFHGIAPEPVKASPHEVTLKDGTVKKMEGGYSPVTFASSLSKGAETVEDAFGDHWGPARPSDSHLKARTNTDRRPLSLELNDELKVMGQMIHWVSFADAVTDANKIIGDKAIRAHMIAAGGEENFKEIPKWLKATAGNNPFSSTPISRLLGWAKNASMIANLGLKTTSEVKHLFNYSMTFKELGPQYAAKGVQTFLGNPMKTLDRWNEIKEMDPYMRQWAANWDRDISAAAKRLNIGGHESIFGSTTLFGRAMSVKDALTHNFTRMLFSVYGVAYTAIGGSAWEGAYLKAMDGEVDGIKAGDSANAIKYAGRTVRTTIAAGNIEDLPSIMRDTELGKLMTWFYGPMNLLANNVQKDYQRFAGSNKAPKDMAKFASAEMLNILPVALMGSLLVGEAPKAKDDLKKFVKWGAGAVASEFAGMVPLIRDIPYMIKTKAHSFNDPFADVFASPIWSLVDIGEHVLSHKRYGSKELKDLGMTAGYLTELPSRQVMDSWATAHDWLSGHYRPSSTASGLWHVATGKEPKR